MIPASWQFGPFARGLAQTERVARLRSLRTVVQLHCGPRGQAAARALSLAETCEDAGELAVGALERLDPLDRRRVLASYQRIAQPL